MPNKPAANKTTWALWIDRDLLRRFRAVVPRGERQDAVRDAIAAMVRDREAKQEAQGVDNNREGG